MKGAGALVLFILLAPASAALVFDEGHHPVAVAHGHLAAAYLRTEGDAPTRLNVQADDLVVHVAKTHLYGELGASVSGPPSYQTIPLTNVSLTGRLWGQSSYMAWHANGSVQVASTGDLVNSSVPQQDAFEDAAFVQPQRGAPVSDLRRSVQLDWPAAAHDASGPLIVSIWGWILEGTSDQGRVYLETGRHATVQTEAGMAGQATQVVLDGNLAISLEATLSTVQRTWTWDPLIQSEGLSLFSVLKTPNGNTQSRSKVMEWNEPVLARVNFDDGRMEANVSLLAPRAPLVPPEPPAVVAPAPMPALVVVQDDVAKTWWPFAAGAAILVSLGAAGSPWVGGAALRLARAAYDAQRRRRQRAWAWLAILSPRSHFEARFLLGDAAYQGGSWHRAARWFAWSAKGLGNEECTALLMAARSWARAGRAGDAARFYGLACSLQPDLAFTVFQDAALAKIVGDPAFQRFMVGQQI